MCRETGGRGCRKLACVGERFLFTAKIVWVDEVSSLVVEVVLHRFASATTNGDEAGLVPFASDANEAVVHVEVLRPGPLRNAVVREPSEVALVVDDHPVLAERRHAFEALHPELVDPPSHADYDHPSQQHGGAQHPDEAPCLGSHQETVSTASTTAPPGSRVAAIV